MSTVETLPPRVWLQHKEKADQAFRAGQYSQAVIFYSDAVNSCISTSATDRAKLFANRALAFQRAGECCSSASKLRGCRMEFVAKCISQDRCNGMIIEIFEEIS